MTKKYKLYDVLSFLFCFVFICMQDFRTVLLGVSLVVFLYNLYLLAFKKKELKICNEVLWFFTLKILFIFWCFFSSFWSYNSHDALYYTTSLVSRIIIMFNVVFVVLFNGSQKFDKAIIYCTVLLCLRIILVVPLSAYELGRIGNYLSLGGGSYGNTLLTYIFGLASCILLFSDKRIIKNSIFKYFIFIIFTLFSLLSGSKKEFFFLIVFLVMFIFWKSKNKQSLILNLCAMPILLLIVYFFLIENDFLYSTIGYRMENFLNFILGNDLESDLSSINRLNFLRDAYNVFLTRPFIGVGLDNFKYFNTFEFAWAENNIMELLADVGLIGILLYYLPFAPAFLKISLIRKKRTKFYRLLALFIVVMIIELTMVTYRDSFLQFCSAYLFVIFIEENTSKARNFYQGDFLNQNTKSGYLLINNVKE